MKKTLAIFLLACCSALWPVTVCGQSAGENPAASSESYVVFGNARFTVLTPRLVRMEWSADGKFEDRATLGIVNRKLDVPAFKVTKRGNKTIIRTDSLTLTYTGQDKFDSDNLEVSFSMTDFSGRKPIERKVSWHPGADDSGNLLGTTRTLDGCDGVKTKEPYDPGVISRDGWAIIDESERHVLVPDDSDWGEWVAERDSADRLDLYIFAYGHDYKAAVSDFTKIAGKIPLPPKFAFGYWWSRYWQYSDFEFTDLAKQMRSLDIPIDVMVVDMDWHETWSLRKKNAPKDEYGQRIGWTGYTWQKQLFPNPANFLQDIHNLGMKTSLNLHPASGIQPYEDCYDRFVTDYTSRTDNYDGPEGYVNEKGEKVSVPFRISDKDWTEAYSSGDGETVESTFRTADGLMTQESERSYPYGYGENLEFTLDREETLDGVLCDVYRTEYTRQVQDGFRKVDAAVKQEYYIDREKQQVAMIYTDLSEVQEGSTETLRIYNYNGDITIEPLS